MEIGDGGQPAAPQRRLLRAAMPCEENHTFASYLQAHQQLVMHPKLRNPVRCICDEWRHAAGNDEEVARGRLVLEGRTCLNCAKEICVETHYLQYLLPMGRGRDKPLHHAVTTKNLTMFCHLITCVGADRNLEAAFQVLRETNERAETALHVAIITDFRDAVELMLWMHPQLVGILCHGVSPIYLAVSLWRKELAEMLHHALVALGPGAADAGRYYSGPKGMNALHAAISLGDQDMIEMVLRWDQNNKLLIKEKDENGNSPLHSAVLYRPRWLWLWWAQPFRLLNIILQADPDMAHEPNNEGFAPVHIAAMKDRRLAVDFLCRMCSGCIFLRDHEGRTFLHIAAQNNSSDVVSYVCARSEFASLMNIQDKNGNTALHLAVEVHNLAMVCALLQNQYVSLNIWNDKGQTALDLARSRIRPGVLYSKNPDKFIHKTLKRVGAKHGSKHYYSQRETEQNNAEKQEREKQESDKLTKATKGVGILSGLIATVTFGATFGVPGGYKADDHVNGGTPTLAGRWYFDAFIVANTMAFVWSSISIVGLMYTGMPMVLLIRIPLFYLSQFFAIGAVASLAAVIGLGLYMVLAPVSPTFVMYAIYVLGAFCMPIILTLTVMNFAILRPIFARRGIWHGTMSIARYVLKSISVLLPFALIYGFTKALRSSRSHV